MRTPNDAMRSVKKYVALALGDEWEVRNWSDEGSFAPPFARVAQTAPITLASRRVYTDLTTALQIHCYQAPGDSPSDALAAARDVQQRLIVAFELGVGLAFPRRIPLYDYEGVPETKGSDTRQTYDFLKVLDHSVNTVLDGDDDHVAIVVADIRISWSQATTIVPVRETVNLLRVEERAS